MTCDTETVIHKMIDAADDCLVDVMLMFNIKSIGFAFLSFKTNLNLNNHSILKLNMRCQSFITSKTSSGSQNC